MFRVYRYYFSFIFVAAFLIKFQPQIIDSLLAIKIFLVNRIAKIVGVKPANPGIAEMTISVLLKFFYLIKII